MYQQIATRISRRAVIKHEIAISRVAKANIKAFHSTRTRAFSNPKDPPNTPPSPLKPTKDVVKEVGVEETLSNETTSKPSTAGAKEDIDKIGQAPDDAQSQQSRDSNGYEASDFVLRSTRRRRMGVTLRGRQRTGKNLTPYKPVIPDEFLKTNYIRFTENLASFDTMEYPLQECIRQEIVCSARASLLATPISDSVPAKRGHLLLNCPLEGATYYLDAIVNSTAACLHADLLKFDRQDLMELTADVFARKSNITPWPLFPDLKGFNPYISASPYSTASSMSAEEDVDEDVYIEEEDTYDASHHMTKFPAFDNKAYSETLPFNGSNNTAATRGDMKTMMDKINKFFEALVVVKPLTDLNEHTARRNATSKLKIIYFKDIGDIPPSNFTVQLVNSLVDAVQVRRAMGEKILIIAGYSPSLFAMEKKPPSACVVPHELHLMNSDVFPNPAMLVSFTHIAIPPPSDDMAKKLLDLISRDKNLAIRYLNTRNIKAVGASKGAYFKCNSVEELGRILARLDGIDTEVWGFERIHRLVMNAIGLALERHDHVTSNGRVDIEADDFIRAANILRVNQNLRKNFVESVSNSAKIGTKNVANVISVLGVGDVKVNIVNSKSLKLGELDRYEKRFSGCIVEAANIQTGFSDIHVTQTTIETLQTLITLPLLRPDYFSYGVLKKHFISGVLLFGPPGTGKTMLAKAVAKESGSAVLDIKASDVYDMYVGEGEKNVRAIFSLARKLSPCVIFLDEVDAIFGSRRSDINNGAHREIINQFMAEWDGLTSKNEGVLVMGATNRPFDIDDAILRRMPRRILVDLPTEKDREQILHLHLRDEQLDPAISMAHLAKTTHLYSGSDLKNLCISAALAAIREAARSDILTKPSTKTVNSNDKVPFPRRILRSEHFQLALKQITPSCSEDMTSLSELRKWDSLYGDGAWNRRKRMKGIGFDGSSDISDISTNGL